MSELVKALNCILMITFKWSHVFKSVLKQWLCGKNWNENMRSERNQDQNRDQNEFLKERL